MKRTITAFSAVLVLLLASQAQAEDNNKSPVQKAVQSVRDRLPAEVHESTGTPRAPQLNRPDPNRRPEPRPEPPSPVSSDRRVREGQVDPQVRQGWDDHQKQHGGQQK
jgi:hypothetical protein